MEKFIMKKQIIAAAVAASVSAVAVADISITGSAKYEYLYTDYSDTTMSKNESNTEMKLAVKGKNGDTSVFIGLELDGSDASDNGAERLDVEDMYLTTKVGDINVKAGNWTAGSGNLMGELLNRTRASNKVDLSTTLGGVKVYAGNSGTAGNGFGALNAEMYAGAVFNVAGATVEAKHVSPTEDAFGIKGELGGVSYRVETRSHDTANSDATFAEFGTKIGGMGVSYAMINSDPGVVTEDDSAIFAIEMGHSAVSGSTDDAQQQVTVTTSVDGNNLTFKAGTIDNAFGAAKDLDYMQVVAARPLASGATATVTYTDWDTSTSASTETLEIDLSVSF
jgi:hypothetical protein